MFRYNPDSDFGRLGVAAAISAGVALFATVMSEHAATRRHNASNPFSFVGHVVETGPSPATKLPLPPDKVVVWFPTGNSLAIGGPRVVLGSRVSVTAFVRVGGSGRVLKLVTNAPAIELKRESDSAYDCEWAALAVTPEEAELLELAGRRGWPLNRVVLEGAAPAERDPNEVRKLLAEWELPVAPPPRPVGEGR